MVVIAHAVCLFGWWLLYYFVVCFLLVGLAFDLCVCLTKKLFGTCGDVLGGIDCDGAGIF